MIREDRFLISNKPYAIDLSTLSGSGQKHGDSGRYSFSGSADALWFRRKAGITRACMGSLKLWRHYLTEPLDASDPVAVLNADLDGRYGGDCHARWDGERYWGAQEPFRMALDMTVLEPMLASFPAVPDGYDGWWRF
ncbi:hypothetical protein [Streptomyces sp. Wb2n-11]|uniref:hypothetical protein n=1 Tax=Streptomyces sp. Wb2n-11 TaxID=1030533 RepID=UPI000AAB99C7|nr:hypothetical protein [Streptomyces sp. Wb2n-11]